MTNDRDANAADRPSNQETTGSHGTSERGTEYEPGHLLEVTVERIVPNGFGLAFVSGLTIFVALAVEGDRLRVRLVKVKGPTAFAEIEEILTPSEFRILPPCRFFGVCGGCDFQQMSYEKQLSTKVEMLIDSLRRIGKFEIAEVPIIPCPRPFGYRTRALWRGDVAPGNLGYYKRDSHDTVDIDHCMVLDPTLDSLMQEIRSSIKRCEINGDKVVFEASVGSEGRPSVFSRDVGGNVEEIVVEAAGERYLSEAATFFQGNLSLVEELIAAATGGLQGSFALDLYCGVGLFSLPLGRRFSKVIGVESGRRSIDLARRNASAAGLRNIEFYTSGVQAFLENYEGETPDLVLLDPPRAGTEKNVIRNVIRLGPKHVSYVACDTAVLARDLRRLVDGGYRIERLVALDLFPQTHHVETVARLIRES